MTFEFHQHDDHLFTFTIESWQEDRWHLTLFYPNNQYCDLAYVVKTHAKAVRLGQRIVHELDAGFARHDL